MVDLEEAVVGTVCDDHGEVRGDVPLRQALQGREKIAKGARRLGSPDCAS